MLSCFADGWILDVSMLILRYREHSDNLTTVFTCVYPHGFENPGRENFGSGVYNTSRSNFPRNIKTNLILIDLIYN